MWARATHRAGQPQIVYPNAGVLAAFAHEVWEEGFYSGNTCGMAEDKSPYQ